jgi:hypothetical protein
MARFIRILALFALCAVLVAPLAAAAAPLAAGQPSPIHLTVGAGDFFGWLHGALTAFWLKNGCRADPDGLCLLPPPPPNGASDNGCRLDPDGLCKQ